MTELLQNLIDGLGRGSIYALLALGVAVVFGVMHLLNFAHGELITVSGYATFWAMGAGWSWYLTVALIVVVSVATSLAIERVAFSRVRGADDFTLLRHHGSPGASRRYGHADLEHPCPVPHAFGGNQSVGHGPSQGGVRGSTYRVDSLTDRHIVRIP